MRAGMTKRCADCAPTSQFKTGAWPPTSMQTCIMKSVTERTSQLAVRVSDAMKALAYR